MKTIKLLTIILLTALICLPAGVWLASVGNVNAFDKKAVTVAEVATVAVEEELSITKVVVDKARTIKTTVHGEQHCTERSPKEIYYKVQLAAYHHTENYNNGHLAKMGQLQTRDIDNITRFTIGTFNTLKEARQFKKMIVNGGSKDAFITAEVNGKRTQLYELKREERKNERKR